MPYQLYQAICKYFHHTIVSQIFVGAVGGVRSTRVDGFQSTPKKAKRTKISFYVPLCHLRRHIPCFGKEMRKSFSQLAEKIMYKLDMKLRAMRNSNDDGLEESSNHHLFLLFTYRKKRSQESARRINRRSYTSETDYQMLRNRSSSCRHILLLCVFILFANINVRAIIRSRSSSSSSGTPAFVIPFNELNLRQVASWRALPSTPSVAPSTILNPSHDTLHLLMSGRGGASSSMTAVMMQPLQQQKKEEGNVAIKHHQVGQCLLATRHPLTMMI